MFFPAQIKLDYKSKSIQCQVECLLLWEEERKRERAKTNSDHSLLLITIRDMVLPHKIISRTFFFFFFPQWYSLGPTARNGKLPSFFLLPRTSKKKMEIKWKVNLKDFLKYKSKSIYWSSPLFYSLLSTRFILK